MGACNCGFLAQVVTERSPREIHINALRGRGDWSEQLIDYCPSTRFGMDLVIGELIEFGFGREDLTNLERLSDTQILARLPNGGSHIMHNSKVDVIAYLNAWALVLEDNWASTQPTPSIDSLHSQLVMAG